MENLTQALYIAFAVAVFVIAFTVTLYLVDKVNTTSETLVWSLDSTKYYDSLELTDLISDNDGDTNNTSRIVGIDTIIPSLYRYYKESFAVKILDEKGNLMQYFDTTTEGEVNTAASTIASARTEQQKALLSLYNASGNSCYLFGTPWLGGGRKYK
jgi:hypothetical protein